MSFKLSIDKFEEELSNKSPIFLIDHSSLYFVNLKFYSYSLTSTSIALILRFEEFTDEWEIKSLKSITDRLTRKNKNLETNNPLTISAQQGLISQTDFFNKVIASDNLKDYYLLKKGEFAYNKSYSNEYPYGAIKRLDLYNEGAISTLYICFTVNDYVDSDFLTIYFESDKWYKEIYKIAVEGARNHGLLNIGVNDFFNTKHNIPSLDEQKKISSFLMAVDKKLKLLNDKKTNFLKFKKYLLQNMFPQNDEKTPNLGLFHHSEGIDSEEDNA